MRPWLWELIVKCSGLLQASCWTTGSLKSATGRVFTPQKSANNKHQSKNEIKVTCIPTHIYLGLYISISIYLPKHSGNSRLIIRLSTHSPTWLPNRHSSLVWSKHSSWFPSHCFNLLTLLSSCIKWPQCSLNSSGHKPRCHPWVLLANFSV